MKTNQTSFAFKLADAQKASDAGKTEKWQARDGVSIAGCSSVGHGCIAWSDGIIYC